MSSVIFVGEDGWTDMARDLPEERATSAHGFHKPWWKGVKLYHRNGYRYEVENATPEDAAAAAVEADRRDAPTIRRSTCSTGFDRRVFTSSTS